MSINVAIWKIILPIIEKTIYFNGSQNGVGKIENLLCLVNYNGYHCFTIQIYLFLIFELFNKIWLVSTANV